MDSPGDTARPEGSCLVTTASGNVQGSFAAERARIWGLPYAAADRRSPLAATAAAGTVGTGGPQATAAPRRARNSTSQERWRATRTA